METIELDMILEYRSGKVYVKRFVTNDIPAKLVYNLVESLNKTIIEFHKNKQWKMKISKKQQ